MKAPAKGPSVSLAAKEDILAEAQFTRWVYTHTSVCKCECEWHRPSSAHERVWAFCAGL